MRRIVFVLSISALSLIVGCGGSSSKSSSAGTSVAGGNTIVTSGNNVAPLIVDAGPVPSVNAAVNKAFTTVVVCAPGTSNCVTIDHVAVDTGSTGLRIPVTAFSAFTNGASVLAALQNVNPTTPVAECVQFLDNSFFFGAVKLADVKMGGPNNTGEVAGSVPIHVMGDTSVPTGTSIPSDCSTVTSFTGTQVAGTEEDTVEALGENGLLGVGNFQYDCDVLGVPTGAGSNTFGIGSSNPCASSSTPPSGTYYSCPSTGCSASLATAVEQVRNPVSLFADNNGVIIELPAVPVGGQSAISAGQASLVFGIGTQANNGLSNAVVLPVDSNFNDAAWMGFITIFNGHSYPSSTNTDSSFIDSGSNALFFLDQPTSGIPSCSSGLYCPASTESLTAVNQATGGASRGTQFNVSNGDTLSASNTAFSDRAAPQTSGVPDAATQTADGFFDWGLPFFYGRNVYTSIWGVAPPSTPASGGSVPAGPFWAY